LFDGRTHQEIDAQVKFEDGRTSTIRADVQIRDAAVAAPQRKAA
jgi:RNase H-fold protein (predicted Holliday junction resolvase)